MNYAGLTKQQLEAAIEAADSLDTLNAIWQDLARVGYSTEGLLYARIVARKGALGVELSELEHEIVTRANARREHGKTLPSIIGKIGR